MEERLKQLKAEREQIKIRLNEINYLIEGYENALKEKDEKK